MTSSATGRMLGGLEQMPAQRNDRELLEKRTFSSELAARVRSNTISLRMTVIGDRGLGSWQMIFHGVRGSGVKLGLRRPRRR